MNIAKLLTPFLLMLFTGLAHAGWMDDWFDSTISSSGDSHYSNQQRGYYSLGHYGGRLNVSKDYPISISKPRIKSGCGGVDIFMGGASFMDADYLVKKFENMIQAAPAIIFDMALTTMSAQVASSMKQITKIKNG